MRCLIVFSRCVGICPEGTYANEEGKVCLPCHPQCRSCRNATEISCVSCKSDFFLIHDQMTCMESCPEKYYTGKYFKRISIERFFWWIRCTSTKMYSL